VGKKIEPREVFCAVEQALDPPIRLEALVVRRAARRRRRDGPWTALYVMMMFKYMTAV
jgi:hypothetical protein